MVDTLPFAAPAGNGTSTCIAERVLHLAARRGLRVRPFVDADIVAVDAIARRSLAAVPGLFDDDVLRPYDDEDAELCSAQGRGIGAVAERIGGRVAAFVFCQLRHDGDVHVREVAAWPRDAAHHVPGAGSAVLALALAHAVDAGCRGRVTCNVIHEQRVAAVGAGRPDPAAFYRRLGLQHRPGAAGYRADGLPRDPSDLWLDGDAAAALAALVDRLAGRDIRRSLASERVPRR